MPLSEQDREFIELAAERAAEKAARAAVAEMAATIESRASNVVLHHALVCEAKPAVRDLQEKVGALAAGASGAWKALAVVCGVVAFLLSTGVAVWAVVK